NTSISTAVMTNEPGSSPTLVPVATNRASAPASTPPPPPNAPNLRDQKPPIFTNDTQIALDYEVERLGPSGISKIEVWITQDEGKTWMRWQEVARPDSGLRQPLVVRLPEQEGVFGYRLVVFSGSQLTAGPPQPMDEPEIRVHIDRTRPVVTLYKPEPDPMQPNALILQWSVKDANLTEKPIRLQWAENPTGEWHDITAAPGVANTGRLAWVPPPGVPLKVYLRISAEDMAGNI